MITLRKGLKTMNLKISVASLIVLLSFQALCLGETQVTYLFAHGIADTYKQAYRYKKGTSIIPERYIMDNGHLVTFNFPDATEGRMRVNRAETSLGQWNEIGALQEVYEAAQSNDAFNKDFVLFGLSRGASTVINFMALYNPTPVQALILESPYDSVPGIVDGVVKKINMGWAPGMHSLIHNAMAVIFARYEKDGIQPIDVVHRIRTDLPILIICSQQDTLVPETSSMKLYNKLKESGHEHTYILTVDHGKHAKILIDEDGQTYTDVVHAFYKKYKMPHNAAYADAGEALLNSCQP